MKGQLHLLTFDQGRMLSQPQKAGENTFQEQRAYQENVKSKKNDNFILGHLKRPRLFFTIPYVYLFVCVWILYHLLFWHGRDCEGLWMACVLPSAVSGEAGRGICHGHCRACCTQTGQLRLSQGELVSIRVVPDVGLKMVDTIGHPKQNDPWWGSDFGSKSLGKTLVKMYSELSLFSSNKRFPHRVPISNMNEQKAILVVNMIIYIHQ